MKIADLKAKGLTEDYDTFYYEMRNCKSPPSNCRDESINDDADDVDDVRINFGIYKSMKIPYN
jgi:hypothetical protein